MLDDFFTRALLAGIGIALVAGPIGCFMVWKRLAYFGDTLAHGALLGVAIALVLQLNVTLSVVIVSILMALLLLVMQSRARVSTDALLGLLSHSALALGLVALSFMTWLRVDLNGLLFGDILSVSRQEILVIWLGGAFILGVLYFIWRPLFAATVDRDLALAEGHDPDRTNLVFTILVACIIAIALKIIGVLLITAMLIIPAATARRFSAGPEIMAVIASLLGIVSVCAGLYGSLQWDTPSGPSIVVAALLIFIIGVSPLGGMVAHYINEKRHARYTGVKEAEPNG